MCPESSTAASTPQEYPHIDTRGYVHYGKTTGFRDLGDLDVAALQQRVAGLDQARDERPVLGALHQAVDIAIDVHVDRVGPARGQGAAEHGGHHEPHRRHAPLGHNHRGHRGHEEELDDAGLGERDVPAYAPMQGGRSGRKHDDTLGPRPRGRQDRKKAARHAARGHRALDCVECAHVVA